MLREFQCRVQTGIASANNGHGDITGQADFWQCRGLVGLPPIGLGLEILAENALVLRPRHGLATLRLM